MKLAFTSIFTDFFDIMMLMGVTSDNTGRKPLEVVKVFKRPPVSDPLFVQMLFGEPSWSWLWLVVRLYLGWAWVEAGWHKVTDPRWVGTGEALQAFWTNVVKIPATGRPPITYDWYREFIRFLLDSGTHTWFAKLVAYGEFLVGIVLIAGLFTGFAAVAGAFLNLNFMLAGASSTNPILFLLAMLLLMAWKNAGYLGLDYWVLPAVGTPWAGKRTESPGTGTWQEPRDL